MATYIEQSVTANGEMTRREYTDDEACVLIPPQILFTTDSLTVKADGKTPVTIRLQLVSAPLSDESQRPIHEARTFYTLQDGEREPVTLDENGYAEIQAVFMSEGRYHFTTDGIIYSQGITIEAL